MLAKRLLALLCFTVATAPFFGGCAADSDGDDDGEGEEEPVGETNDELRSAVSCKETTAQAYRAGQPYTIQVIHVGGKPVAKPTGHAFLKMQAAAHAAGVRLSLTSGFRTMEEQRRLYNCYLTKSCNHGNLAARPGYSNHQNGLALDISTSVWLAKNASKFGFVRTVSKEAWHYEFRGKDPGGPCSRGAEAEAATRGSDEEGGDDDSTGSTTTNDVPRTRDGLAWVAPAQDQTLKNGFTVKSRAKDASIVKVAYSQGTLTFGTSTRKDNDFALDYSFNYMGDKTLTAKGYDAQGELVAVDNVDFTVVP